MSQTIQVKRGFKKDIPLLEEGEMGFCIDTKEIYIGDGTKNILVNDNISYSHDQLTASTEWVINHNLNKYPNVTIVDSAGSEVFGDLTYIDSNTVRIKFNAAFSGTAYLN